MHKKLSPRIQYFRFVIHYPPNLGGQGGNLNFFLLPSSKWNAEIYLSGTKGYLSKENWWLLFWDPFLCFVIGVLLLFHSQSHCLLFCWIKVSNVKALLLIFHKLCIKPEHVWQENQFPSTISLLFWQTGNTHAADVWQVCPYCQLSCLWMRKFCLLASTVHKTLSMSSAFSHRESFIHWSCLS